MNTDKPWITDEDNWDNWDLARITEMVNEISAGEVSVYGDLWSLAGDAIGDLLKDFLADLATSMNGRWTGTAADQMRKMVDQFEPLPEEITEAFHTMGGLTHELAGTVQRTQNAVNVVAATSVADKAKSVAAGLTSAAIGANPGLDPTDPAGTQARSDLDEQARQVMRTVFTPSYQHVDANMPQFPPIPAVSGTHKPTRDPGNQPPRSGPGPDPNPPPNSPGNPGTPPPHLPDDRHHPFAPKPPNTPPPNTEPAPTAPNHSGNQTAQTVASGYAPSTPSLDSGGFGGLGGGGIGNTSTVPPGSGAGGGTVGGSGAVSGIGTTAGLAPGAADAAIAAEEEQAAQRAGMPFTMAPQGGRKEEDREHLSPDYVLAPEGIFGYEGAEGKVVPPVIGEDDFP